MSLSLTLIPDLDYDPRKSVISGYCRLPFPYGERELEEAIKPFVMPLGAALNWYGDEGVEEVTTTPYGDALTYIRAGDLAPFLRQQLAQLDGLNWRSQSLIAVAAFISTLNFDMRVIIYWN